MRAILAGGGYIPHYRLDRTEIARLLGSGGGKGTRSVAAPDEDTTTMGVAAARIALSNCTGLAPDVLWFSTTRPAYVDKTNANALAAALRLDEHVGAFDFGGGLRSPMGALAAALSGTTTTLVVAADQRDGLPTSADEAAGGDGAVALVIGNADERSTLARCLASASASDEFTDRWRTPGDTRSKLWEERFGELRYVQCATKAVARATKEAGLELSAIDRVIVTGMHTRAVKAVGAKLKVTDAQGADDLCAVIGAPGAAQPLLVLLNVLENESAGTSVALINLADGADVVIFEVGYAMARERLVDQLDQGVPVSYGKYLTWRGQLTPEPPRRPEPARVSSTAAWRSEDWKFAFVASRDRADGALHLPPQRVSMTTGSVDDMEPAAMADTLGTVVTFTVDRMAYSANPPIVFAVVDFDGGGRYPVELTDCEPDDVAIGTRIEMTFRRIGVSDGIVNYFWKGRPIAIRSVEESP